LVTMKARQASPVQQQPAANERTARPSTPAIRTARSISTQRRRGLFGGPSSQLRTPGEATSNASKGVRLGRRSRGADSQRAAATPGDSASLTPAPTSRRSRLPILLKRATPILQKPKSSGEPLTAQSKMASQSEPRTSRDDKISRERDKSMSPSSTRTARAQSVSAGSRDDQLTREIDRIRKEIVAEPDTGLVEASTTTRTSEAGATEGASTKSGSAGKTPSQKSKSRRRWLRSIDSRPSYYGSEKRVKKINKRNLKKRSRSQRSGSTLPHASEDKTQQISDDAKSDARDGLNVHRDGSPTLKTAITEIDPALAKAISEAAQNLQPGSIVIHEQNQDGSFKLELHLACRINSTGRLNLSGCAPAGLRPKKVNVNGKEIWAEI
uniref:SCP domain-containing protein n=1 Tax=Heligmosomoides polygyrus TaxID=6339 RepID=A0A183FTW7_HELPZ